MQESREVEVVREIGGRKLILRAGKLAKQAAGSVWVQYGETVVLVAATVAPCRREIDFFPLFMDYREKQYAAGKVPRGFYKREGRPTDKEILTMRLMDRPTRPLFPDGYVDEVQVQAIVLSFDQENESDVLAMIGASAALTIAPQTPFEGPFGAVRIGRKDGKLIVNPTIAEAGESDMEMVIAATDPSIVMIEVGANELPEEELVEGFELAHNVSREIIAMQRELAEKLGVRKVPFQAPAPDGELVAEVEKYADQLRTAIRTLGKAENAEAISQVQQQVFEALSPADDESPRFTRPQVAAVFGEMKKRLIREAILAGQRPDGRTAEQLRPISCEIGILPRTHGSALFTRGETQALVSATLGTTEDQQVIDGLSPEYRKKFMLQYNFPPFSVGEVRPLRGPSRRDIGHGNLAEKSLNPVMPGDDKFAYTTLVVSEIMESNGSSSMATVCGATLAMMDGGVPIKDPVAGISIGLVQEGDKELLLTDIVGAEDHYGDMDFKVAGTQNGITGIQLDLKNKGVSLDLLRRGLAQARQARGELLKIMLEAISAPRGEISAYAPRLLQIKIDPEKIGKVIGPGGSVIKAMQSETNSRIEIQDDGTVTISSTDAAGAEEARRRIEVMTETVNVGKTYSGTVRSITDFGAFIEILPGQDGLCHISELSDGYVKKVEDVVKLGDTVSVKVINIDNQGRIKLSRKALLKEEGKTDVPQAEGEK